MRLKSALLFALYRVLTTLLVFPGACYLAIHRRRDPHYGKKFWQLLGLNLPSFERGCVVFHAASMGEANAIKPLINEFKKAHPHINVVATTMTTTGAQSLKAIENITVCFSPLDNYFCIKHFFKKLQPQMIITADTELWPEKLIQARKHDCLNILVNARMQEKNCQAYLRHKEAVVDLIASKLSLVLCADKDDQSRYIKIGVRPEWTKVNGNLKYDLKADLVRFTAGVQIKSQLKGPVLGAISTHSGEEVLILKNYLQLKKSIPNLSLVLVPRHKQGSELAAKYLQDNAIPYIMKSQKGNDLSFNGGILLGNTLGEIALYFGLCDLVFMGGSFTTTGGHNPLEPACYGLASITGPDFHNFRSEYRRLTASKGAFVVNTPDEFCSLCKKMLTDLNSCKQAGANAKKVLHSGQGAVQRTLNDLEILLRA